MNKRLVRKIILCLLAAALALPLPAAAASGRQTCKMDAVQFEVPGDWLIRKNPSPGIRLLAQSPPGAPKILFLYQGVSPNNFSAMKDRPKELALSLKQLSLMSARALGRKMGAKLEPSYQGMSKIGGLDAVVLEFRTGSAGQTRGKMLMVFVLAAKAAYGFVAISGQSDKGPAIKTLDEIIASIKIDMAQAKKFSPPTTAKAVMAKVKQALEVGMAGMPTGWEWKVLKTYFSGKGPDKAIEADLLLNHPNALHYINCYAKVMQIFKEKGRAPKEQEIDCMPTKSLMQFTKQYSMISGLLLSQLVQAPGLKIETACLRMQDGRGKKGPRVCLEVKSFLQAIQKRDMIGMSRAMTWSR